MSKAAKIIILILVLGLPVAWYLFLQFFGENKFELPAVSALPEQCQTLANPGKAVLLIKAEDELLASNEWQRVKRKLGEVSGEIGRSYTRDTLCLENFDMRLIDDQRQIVGEYMMTRMDVDRFLAEIDIFLMDEGNGTGTDEQ